MLYGFQKYECFSEKVSHRRPLNSFYFPFIVSFCLKKYNNLSKYLKDNGAKEAL